MKRGAAVSCDADQDAPLHDAVAHYVLFQPETASDVGTEEPSHSVNHDAVYVVSDSSDACSAAATADWLSTPGSSSASPPEQTAKKTRTRKKYSLVWEHFDRHPLDKCTGVCRHCNMSVRLGKEGGCSKLGTTAMRRHLEIHHAELLPDSLSGTNAARMQKLYPTAGADDVAQAGDSNKMCLSGKLGRQSSSSVWQHFDYCGSSKFLVVCKICRMQVRLGNESGCDKVGTTAMHKHVTIHHRLRLKKNAAPEANKKGYSQKLSVSSKLSRELPASSALAAVHHEMPETSGHIWEPHNPASVALNHSLAMYMANGIQPFSLAEDPAFLEFMHHCVPQWKVPSKNYFADAGVPAIATMVRERVRRDLKACVGKTIHLGAEAWQGPHMSDLVSVTAFWMKRQEPNGNLVRCKAVLDVVNLGESCTLENVNQTLETVIKSCLLPAKLTVGNVVTERTSSGVQPFMEMQLNHITCMAHCLDFEVENLLFIYHSQLGDAFEVTRTICNQLCSSDTERAKLKTLQSHHNLKQRQLVPDCPTDWKSTLHMIKHFCEQKLAVNEYLKESGRAPISPEQWLVLRDAAGVLQPVEEVVRLLSMDTAVLGQVLPLLCFAEKMLQGTMERSERGSPAHWLSAHLLSKLGSSSHISSVKADITYWTASFLDPRFRDTFCSYIGGSQAVAEQKLNKVKKHLLVKICETYRHAAKLLHAATPAKSELLEPVPTLDEDFSLWLTNAEQMGLTKSKVEVSSDSADTERAIAAKFELEGYMQDSVADFCAPMSDPVVYWQTKRMVWPSLYAVAVESLTCPPTNTYSERMFEKYGPATSEGRQGISADTLSLLCFIRMNHEWVTKDVSAMPADVFNSLCKSLDRSSSEYDSARSPVDTDGEVLLKRVLFQD